MTHDREIRSDEGKRRRINPYEKLKRAYDENRGTRLTAEDVDKLMSDTAIHDAVMETYADEPF